MIFLTNKELNLYEGPLELTEKKNFVEENEKIIRGDNLKRTKQEKDE